MNMVQNYQEEQELRRREPEAARLATVSHVGWSGLELIFDGEQQSDGKLYLCNNGIKYQIGDRVLVQKVGGSYIVVCRVGEPHVPIRVDQADEAFRAIQVDNMAGTVGDIEFYMDTHKELRFHCVADDETRWAKLTGTEGTPGNLNRPSWP